MLTYNLYLMQAESSITIDENKCFLINSLGLMADVFAPSPLSLEFSFVGLYYENLSGSGLEHKFHKRISKDH